MSHPIEVIELAQDALEEILEEEFPLDDQKPEEEEEVVIEEEKPLQFPDGEDD